MRLAVALIAARFGVHVHATDCHESSSKHGSDVITIWMRGRASASAGRPRCYSNVAVCDNVNDTMDTESTVSPAQNPRQKQVNRPGRGRPVAV